MANKKRRIADKSNDTVKKGNDIAKQAALVSFNFKYLTISVMICEIAMMRTRHCVKDYRNYHVLV